MDMDTGGTVETYHNLNGDVNPGRNNAVILHTRNQRAASEKHALKLTGRGIHSTPTPCDDLTWFQKADVSSFDELHLIIDTSMFANIMKNGSLDKRAKKLFKEIERSRKKIYLVDNFPEDFDDLFHELPKNARWRWQDSQDFGAVSTGMTGGEASESLVMGTNNGNVLFGNFTVLQTGQDMKILTGVKQGQAIEQNVNFLKMAIKHDQDEDENNRMLTEVEEHKDKLLNGDVTNAKVEKGSVIITLTVEKSRIMTDDWINDQLKIIFNEILASCVAEGTTFYVNVERFVSFSKEELLKLYLGQHHQNKSKDVTVDGHTEKEEILTGEHFSGSDDISEKQTTTDISTQTESICDVMGKEPSADMATDNMDSCKGDLFTNIPISVEQEEELSAENFSSSESDESMNLQETVFSAMNLSLSDSDSTETLLDLSSVQTSSSGYGSDGLISNSSHIEKKSKMRQSKSITWQNQAFFNMVTPTETDYLQTGTISDQILAGYFPLYAAALRGDEKTAKREIEMGVDINGLAEDGSSPILAAAKRGHAGFVEMLLENGADTTRCTENGETALFLAAKYGHLACFNLLIKNGADVNTIDVKGNTLFHVVAHGGCKDILQEVLKSKSHVNQENKRGNTPLHVAAANRSKDVVEILLRSGADVKCRNEKGDTPLHVAAANRSKDVVEILLRSKADVNCRNKRGNTPLHVAAANRSKDIVEILLSSGAEIVKKNMKGNTPLHVATEEGHVVTVMSLLKAGAKVNCRNEKGNTPLHVAAAANRSKDIVEILLRSKADVNCRNKRGKAPLHVAAVNGSENVVYILLRSGAEVVQENMKGNTPLHVATEEGQVVTVMSLLKAGADVNCVNDDSATPQSAAAARVPRDLFGMLRTRKVKLTEGFEEGVTSFDNTKRKETQGGRKEDLIECFRAVTV